MKMKRIIIVLIQVIAIGAAAMFFIQHTENEVKPKSVFIYSGDLGMNTMIENNHLRQIEVPAKAVQDNFVTDKDEVLGKFIGTPVYAGQFVTEENLIEEGEKDPFAEMDLSRYRMISLPVDLETGVGGALKKGSRVDLIYQAAGTATEADEMGMQDSEFTYAKTFLQDVLVHNVITRDGTPYVDRTSEEIGEEEEEQEGDYGQMAVMTLAVTLDQAEEINARSAKGQISMVARFSDSETYETLGFVLGEYEKQFVAPVDVETNRPSGE